MKYDVKKELVYLEQDNNNELISIKKQKPIKSYHGQKWRTRTTNKKHLVSDFSNRCCYCDDLDTFNGGYDNYHVEHFAPKSRFPELEFNYDNLLYCCPYCNKSKSDKWVGQDSTQNVVENKGFLNPCEDEYYIHLARYKNGKIVFLTDLGQFIYNELKLYLNCHEINYKLEKLCEITQKIDEKLKNESISKKQQEILLKLKLEVTTKFMNYYMNNS